LYKFYGITLDSRAARILLAGELQVLALQKRDPSIQINTLITRSNRIKFSKGIATVKGIIQVPIPLAVINFYVVPINTLFLLFL